MHMPSDDFGATKPKNGLSIYLKIFLVGLSISFGLFIVSFLGFYLTGGSGAVAPIVTLPAFASTLPLLSFSLMMGGFVGAAALLATILTVVGVAIYKWVQTRNATEPLLGQDALPDAPGMGMSYGNLGDTNESGQKYSLLRQTTHEDLPLQYEQTDVLDGLDAEEGGGWIPAAMTSSQGNG